MTRTLSLVLVEWSWQRGLRPDGPKTKCGVPTVRSFVDFVELAQANVGWDFHLSLVPLVDDRGLFALALWSRRWHDWFGRIHVADP